MVTRRLVVLVAVCALAASSACDTAATDDAAANPEAEPPVVDDPAADDEASGKLRQGAGFKLLDYGKFRNSRGKLEWKVHPKLGKIF